MDIEFAPGCLTSNGVNGSVPSNLTYTSSGSVLLAQYGYVPNANGWRQTATEILRQVNGVWKSALTTYIYDAMNRVVQTINPDSGTNTVVYNLIGQQQATIDPLGRATTYDYDNQGRLWRTTYPDLTTELSYYDANGNRTNSVDRAGRTTTFVYDALNRLVQTIYPDNTTNRTVYDDVGRVAQTIDARGAVTAFNYDAAGRRLAVTNAVGIAGLETVSSYAYDANGNQITFTDGLGHTTTNVFDALNRQVAVDYPDGTKTLTGYDADGRRVAATNQDTIVTLFGYDGAGRLTSVTNAANTQPTVTRFVYDTAGNETAQIDALGRTNFFAYDNLGRRISHTMPGNQSESFGYDLAGNLISHTDFNGLIVTNLYDSMNRLLSRWNGSTQLLSFTYTATGQRLSMTDVSGVYSYAYDNRDRLRLYTTPAGTLTYSYDANGNLTNITSSTVNGTLLTYQYDPLNRLTNVAQASTPVCAYNYDAVGNLQGIVYPNGVTNLYQYDPLNHLTRLTWNKGVSQLGDFSYQLGLTGNRTNLNETLNFQPSTTYVWQYDNLYRLTNEVVSGASTGNLGYQYDPVGNRTSRTGSLGSLDAQTLAYNTNDWLTSDSYDSNGNTINSASKPYQYDYENRLTNFNNGQVVLVYDGDGNRMKKITGTTTTLYLVDSHNPSGYPQVLEELKVSGGVTNLSRAYTWGLSLTSQRIPGTSTNFFGYDGHGSTRFLTALNGNITDTYVYDTYGTLITSTGNTANNYLYGGEQWDPDSGSYYLRARTYNPGTGRFFTADSFEGNNEDPLSLHKYLYVADNPVNNTDPSGNSVYVVTRPLDDPNGQAAAAQGFVHVFLAFDSDGMNNVEAWEDAVRESWDAAKHPNTYDIIYGGDPDNPTFSFHPKSVRTGDESEEYGGYHILTPGSYVADQARIDQQAVNKTGTGYNKWMVAKGNDLQMMVFKAAVRSRDKNNSGTPDPLPYQSTVFNCGSWVQFILGNNHIAFPDTTINHGVGLLSGTANVYTAGGYIVNGATRTVRSFNYSIDDIFSMMPDLGF
jgi:RHS repeat-associated protein